MMQMQRMREMQHGNDAAASGEAMAWGHDDNDDSAQYTLFLIFLYLFLEFISFSHMQYLFFVLTSYYWNWNSFLF